MDKYWIMFGNNSLDHTVLASSYPTAVSCAEALSKSYQQVVIKDKQLVTKWSYDSNFR